MHVDRKAAAIGPSAAQMVLAAVGALLLAAATLLLSAAFMTRMAPGFGFRTANTRAAILASELDLKSDRASVARQVAAAQAIIARDATNIVAVRSLAILSDQSGQPARSIALLALAERLSRRDATTELALIEVAVARGAITDALRHYDRALTTNPNMADTLVPVLVAAASDPAVARPLAGMMARRPVWWPDMFDRMIAAGALAPSARIAQSLTLRPERATEGWRLSAVIEKLARAGRPDVALRLARQARPRITGRFGDGNFESPGDLPPFDWKLIDSEGLAAVREQRDGAGGNFALSLVAASGQSGIVAYRLLLLAPGRYALSLRAGQLASDPAGRPKVALRCAADKGVRLADTPVDRPVISISVTVPQDCSGQWLELSIAGSPFDTGRTTWIDDVAVEPAT